MAMARNNLQQNCYKVIIPSLRVIQCKQIRADENRKYSGPVNMDTKMDMMKCPHYPSVRIKRANLRKNI